MNGDTPISPKLEGWDYLRYVASCRMLTNDFLDQPRVDKLRGESELYKLRVESLLNILDTELSRPSPFKQGCVVQ